MFRYVKLVSKLCKRYRRHIEDSRANAANKEDLDNFKRDVVNALKKKSKSAS